MFISLDQLDATLQAEQRLPAELRQVFDVFRMGMDSMQATPRGDIQDMRRHSAGPTDLQNIFAHFVVDMESQLSHMMCGPKMLYDIKPRLSSHMVSDEAVPFLQEVRGPLIK